MKRTYFTFGSDPLYPYGRNDYVVVEARNENDACLLFNMIHPPRHDDVVNCAFIYSEERFNEFRDKYYKDVLPIETITLCVNRRG